MTPLQFQKRARLQEARRLMLGEVLDTTSAAHQVGYNDVAYFSRDYKNLFGNPSMRDIQQLRKKIQNLLPVETTCYFVAHTTRRYLF